MARILSDTYVNALIDHEFRGQNMTINGKTRSWSAAPTYHIALLDGAGNELSGNGYARVAVACSLANWAGTQGAGTTVASSGTSAQTSNNADITFPNPTAAWTSASFVAIYDAATGGTQMYKIPLTTPQAGQAGSAPKFVAGSLVVKLDS